MKKISTGQDSTLGTYLGISRFFGKKAERFISDAIMEAPNGDKEEVISDESHMMLLLSSMVHEDMSKKDPYDLSTVTDIPEEKPSVPRKRIVRLISHK